MIAYLLLVHRFPDQFERLFRAIHHPDHHYVVHVDANAEPGVGRRIEAFLSAYPNAAMLKSRPALWGGYSLVDAELRGMARLLEMGADWEFFINLSGQDFPLKSQSAIRAFLSANRGKEFIRAADQAKTRPDTMARVQNYVVERRDRIIRTILRRPFLRKTTPYIGNQWMIVSRRFCEFVCHDPQVERFKRFYRHTFIADEGFFQTVMMNTSAHGEVVNDDLRTIDWIPDGDIKLRPRTFTAADVHLLRSGKDQFARKFDANVDSEILTLLERRIASDPVQQLVDEISGNNPTTPDLLVA
ncbi:MAG: beta-1,6-N-acetylglucosaminyltransferase [Alphaproteobacteria bacterium]|nr:beta-1,6-N-acetylglucosaminyltransferase [Alphaproteobacteria bacterium]MBU2380695.1 beta-1,6-N-acetylglucosaminyltransferase [Alphaproteobacteria bacterium]